MASRSLRIPKSEEESFARLVTLPGERSSALIAALADAQPAFSVRKLAENIAPKVGLDTNDVYSLVRIAAVLYTTLDRSDSALPEFLDQIRRAGEETGRDDLRPPNLNWDDIAPRLRKLLSLDKSLGVTAKALDVLAEHEKVYCNARILTDVRPVFARDVDQAPEALILVHKLRISYHQNGKIRTTYIALDADDIDSLFDILSRASKKEKSLESLAAKTHLPVLRTIINQE